jgi:hypothetical protein
MTSYVLLCGIRHAEALNLDPCDPGLLNLQHLIVSLFARGSAHPLLRFSASMFHPFRCGKQKACLIRHLRHQFWTFRDAKQGGHTIYCPSESREL